MKRAAALLLAPWLAACAGGPVPPDWQANAHVALAAHARAYLNGDDRVAEQELRIARREASRTGAADPLAHVELAACAARLASLAALDGCPAYVPLAQDVAVDLRAYAAYLAGRWSEVDPGLLPEAQRAVPVTQDPMSMLSGIDDPLSRLVASAALLRAGRLPPTGIALAIETASAQGWRRPLLAWLGVERLRLERSGDAAGAAARQRQIERVLAAGG